MRIAAIPNRRKYITQDLKEIRKADMNLTATATENENKTLNKPPFILNPACQNVDGRLSQSVSPEKKRYNHYRNF